MSKTILRYHHFASVLGDYLNLAEFSTLSELTIKGKRLALTQLMNYLGDNGVYIFSDCLQKHVTNHINQITVGRRNWLFSGSPKGAFASAIVYSLVETAKANCLNPYKYLNLLLEILPRFSVKERSEGIEQLLPWNPQVKKECST